ncbi:two-component sensor histidine kinase [Desulfonema ishimotonii]|uniref:histidine kinase n=1 Tax=Desulfonema ishimotonii TaxID=45657 RepID=A0A401FTB3_9BACT|nr:HAMP domain-containing sensor histidine kinase [Desulfonema ishimotonii]GBC60198.1 two-component sensor histidine kinase [Desulfonema ishimotonii]
MRRLGIHVRLLLAALALISATTSALGYMGINIAHQFVQSRFEKRIQFLARYLALNSELGILIGQKGMLTGLAENLLAEKDVVKVVILGEADEVLADVSKENSGQTSVVERPVRLKRARGFPWHTTAKPENQVIGKVRIYYSTEDINRLLSIMKERFLWLSMGLAALCMLMFYFISRSLVAPVSRLADATRQVADGDLSLRVEPGSLPETRELALAFNAMLDSLARSRRALEAAHLKMLRQETLAQMGKFSMMIAHEVKNPLGIIKSSLDILKADIPAPEENTMVLYIEDEIRRLNRLIEDFLSFARPAVPSFRNTDMNAMLRDHVERFELQLNGLPVEIMSHIPQSPCYAEADPDLLMRVVGNVLKNAVEANGQRGTVKLKAACRNGTWAVEIADQGPGIETAHIEKVFEPFFTTRAKGTGLGLAFVYQVISAHAGRIRAENLPEGGARFSIELPVNRTIPSTEETEVL